MTVSNGRILIVGGGFSGMAAAIQFRKAGFDVDMVEKNPAWTAYGAGITIGGPTIRVFNTLGILPDFQQSGFAGEGVDFHDEAGNFLNRINTPPVEGGEHLPLSGAIMRPVLGKILGDACLAGGVMVRTGCTYSELKPDNQGVDVTFTDGTDSHYDLVVGADGLMSKTRRRIFPDAPAPAYTGQGVWRAVLKRPEWIKNSVIWHWQERHYKMGVNPVSQTHMYLFLNDHRPDNDFIPEDRQLPLLKAMLQEFPAPEIKQFAEELGPHSMVIYRPLEALLLPQPWHKGRVVLIGDAVHATTPHLAMGAGIGMEDGVVLAEEVADSPGDIEAALRRFETRRWDRCKLVVDNSLRLGEIEKSGTNQREHTQLMAESIQAIVKPI